MERRFRWSAFERAMIRDGLEVVLRADAKLLRTGRCGNGDAAPPEVVSSCREHLPRGRQLLKALRRGDEVALTPVSIGWLFLALDAVDRREVDGPWSVQVDSAALRDRLRAIDIVHPQGSA